jgi:putative oxygen-independent coproporphyrinogen III oxidase
MTALPPLSLYIHVPWCVRKCPYCDFNSHAHEGKLPEAAYVQRLLDDLKADARHARGRALQSIFIGGGTPSLFSADAYATLLKSIAAQIPLAPDIEITLEANPGTAERGKFAGYREAGINRLSIGVQSFDAGHLQRLGRIHGRDEALRAAEFASTAGFDNFNLDLMFGLPQQDVVQALADLATAIACAPTHVSWYQLTIEPNTEFYGRPPPLPPDDTIAEMQDRGAALLSQHGYARYEISAYAQGGKRARHNLNYWEFGDYLGIGAGAHGKLTQGDGTILRTRKTRMPEHYLDRARSVTTESRIVPAEELPLEFMMNALRLCDGVPARYFTERSGLPWSIIATAVDKLRARGMLDATPECLRPTPRGLLYLNEVLQVFL